MRSCVAAGHNGRAGALGRQTPIYLHAIGPWMAPVPGSGPAGGTTLHSIGQIAKKQRIADNDADLVTPADMLAELRVDNLRLAQYMRETHVTCDDRA